MTELLPSLPPECTIRRGCAKDMWQIRKSVFTAKLDPTQLRWQQFWMIEFQGQLVAFGQLRNFSSSQELGSLFVAPDWRDRGLGTYLTKHLIEQATLPLYLKCVGQRRAQFFARFGFMPISWQELPAPLKTKFSLPQLAKRLVQYPMEFMQYKGF